MLAKNAVQFWAKSGLVWLLFTMTFGMYLGLTQQLGISSPHAHAGLLGGVWAIIFSFLYSRAAPERRFAGVKLQWALYNLGVAGFALALWMTIAVHGSYGMFIPIGGFVTLGATGWIVVSLWRALTNETAGG